MTPEEHEHELVMPFVTVTSRGGPHDDDAYTAGYECGSIGTSLAVMRAVGGSQSLTVTAHAANRPQLDLLAMRYGFTAEDVDPGPDGHAWEGWITLRFSTDES